ncbi:cystatin-like [Amia ocellicauda]|uniref:cystatin-like n=1 Tax=Amia ocellicauda TaxID=2972642 RepID=UPI003463DC60
MADYWQFLCILLSSALLTASAIPLEAIDADPNNQEVRNSAAFALESFNYFSKEPYLYKITKFDTVTMKAIGGGEYTMDVELQLTQCNKGKSADPESCPDITAPAQAKALQCVFVVLNAPWKQERVLIKSYCSPRQWRQ